MSDILLVAGERVKKLFRWEEKEMTEQDFMNLFFTIASALGVSAFIILIWIVIPELDKLKRKKK